jgi:hypothetical protein
VAQSSLPGLMLAAWREYSHRLATYQSWLLLNLVYVMVLGPSASASRLVGQRLLDQGERRAESYWLTRERLPTNLEAQVRQF